MDYNLHKIDELLDQYWAGESSLEEETLLKQYFRFGKVNEKHKAVASVFVVDTCNGDQLSASFDQKILDQLDGGKVVSIKRKSHIWRYVAAACVVALFVTVGSLLNNLDNSNDGMQADTTINTSIPASIASDPEAVEAWQETRKALVALSSRMNKGQKKSLHFSKFNQAQVAVQGESK